MLATKALLTKDMKQQEELQQVGGIVVLNGNINNKGSSGRMFGNCVSIFILSIVTFCLLGVSFTSAQSVLDNRSLDELLSEGRVYFLRGDCELSQVVFQEALKRDEANVTAMMGKARALACQAAYDGAISEYQKAIQADSTNVSAYIQLAINYRNQMLSSPADYPDNLDLALAAVQQAEGVSPNNANVANIKGVIQFTKGDYQSAKSALENAVSIAKSQALANADQSQIYINLGRTYRALGDLQLSQSAFRRSVTLNPGSAEAHSLLGETYFLQQQCDDALYELSQGANLDPSNASSMATLAIATFECGQPNDAEVSIKQALDIDGVSYPELYTYLARIYIGKGRLDDAIREAQKGALLPPPSPEAAYWLGQAYQSKGDMQAAKDAYSRALEIDPEYFQARDAMSALP